MLKNLANSLSWEQIMAFILMIVFIVLAKKLFDKTEKDLTQEITALKIIGLLCLALSFENLTEKVAIKILDNKSIGTIEKLIN